MLGWIILAMTFLFFVFLRIIAGKFMPRPNRPVWLFLILFVLVLSGTFLTVSSSTLLIKSNAKKKWSVTNGRVINSKTVVKGIYLPMIIYAYEVDGRAYVDTTNLQVPGFGNSAKQAQVAEQLVKEYPSGKKIQVHYNPENVSESAIIIRPQWNVYGKIGLGVVLFGAALFFLLLPKPR